MNPFQFLCWVAGLVVASSVGAAEDGSASQVSQQLMTCFNNDKDPAAWIPGNFTDFMQGEVAKLRLHKVMWSSKPAPGSADGPGLTIITAATISRLDSVTAQCRSWSGVLAAAVYVPLKHDGSSGTKLSAASEEELGSATHITTQLFARMEAEPMSCSLRLLLLYELTGDELLGRLLPINSLRNTAMLAATTELMAMVDVDLLPTKRMSTLLTTDAAELQRVLRTCKQKKVVVMPAFETSKTVALVDGRQMAEELVASGDKARVAEAANQGKIIPFAQQAYVPGHKATDSMRWYTSDAAYDVEYQTNYEPWFIVLRAAALLYDARFRGYGWNKATQVAYHNMTGFGFQVHPDLFLVHRPHLKSDAQGFYKKATTRQSSSGDQPSTAKLFHRRVATLRHVAIRQMSKGLYVNYPGAGVAACMQALPWWNGIHPELQATQQQRAAA